MVTDGSPARRFVLLNALVVVDAVVVRELLVVADGAAEADPAGWRRLRRHVSRLVAATGPGAGKRIGLVDLTRFSLDVLRRHVYRGKRPLVGTDLALILTRLAKHVAPAGRDSGAAVGHWACPGGAAT